MIERCELLGDGGCPRKINKIIINSTKNDNYNLLIHKLITFSCQYFVFEYIFSSYRIRGYRGPQEPKLIDVRLPNYTVFTLLCSYE